MGYEELLEKLNKNPREESLKAVRLIIRIADNIINDPSNIKIRTLKKSNPTISKKILQVNGGTMSLKLMGFQESETSFILPSQAKLDDVLNAKDALLMWKESIELSESIASAVIGTTNSSNEESSGTKKTLPENSACSEDPMPQLEPVKPIILPPLQSLYSHPFLRTIETHFHSCLRYADKDLLKRAKKLIPIAILENSARDRLRTLQQHIKKNKLTEPNVSIQEMLLLELLRWFKEDFFSWVDSPACESCGSKTRFTHMSTDKTLMVYTDRVELHRCETCHKFTSFARYDDLNILMETRRGRCGEWANTFTLFCCAMNWDARYVVDQNDHVWTEVYSVAQRRWLHCDPCENICDKPLIYEYGWKKKMSYVIAYSPEEVQDVTWRYSSQHQEVLKRRKFCNEEQLIKVLMELRKNRQMAFSVARRNYLTKRLALELADMLTERKPGDDDERGRQSGEAAWRLDRGEIQSGEDSQFEWHINASKLVNDWATIRYSAAKDVYEFVTGGVVKSSRKKWLEGCFTHANLIRKEEKDWKQVYLARKGDGPGHITWQFKFEEDSDKQLDTIIIHFHHATFENGRVKVNICTSDVSEIIPEDSKMLRTRKFAGKTAVAVEAFLLDGKGDLAWQHAQLFRQPMDSDDFPFVIEFLFK